MLGKIAIWRGNIKRCPCVALYSMLSHEEKGGMQCLQMRFLCPDGGTR